MIRPSIIFLVVIVFARSWSAYAANDQNQKLTSEITEFGVRWTFESPVRFGKFANGHYWIVAPATIMEISPSFDGSRHGWEVNPDSTREQGFDSRAFYFDSSRVPSLPYKAKAGESIVKTISITDKEKCRPCVRAVSALTVLKTVPPNEGATYFRPPYFGTQKPMISTDELRFDLLPQLKKVPYATSLREVEKRYAMVNLDHQSSWVGRFLHPKEAMPDYGSDIANYNTSSALALMQAASDKAKKTALIRYVNNGIDLYYMMQGGVTWLPAGGHGEGRKLPIVFASVLLDRPDMIRQPLLSDRKVFGENGGVIRSEKTRKVLYAQDLLNEKSYWENIGMDKGSRTIADPYGYIDGGFRPGGSYQYCCLSKPWQATVTAVELMPELRPGFGNEDLIEYVHRWESIGAWTQPDQCSPVVGVYVAGENAGQRCTSATEEMASGGKPSQCDVFTSWTENYGVTFGPDGQGSCIKDTDPSDGIGRFPQLHGTSADQGFYSNKFADEMHAQYIRHEKTESAQPEKKKLSKSLPSAPAWKKLEP